MDFNIGGFRPDPNLDDHEAFDSSIHIKSGFLLQGESDWRSMSVKRHNQDTTSTCVANAMNMWIYQDLVFTILQDLL